MDDEGVDSVIATETTGIGTVATSEFVSPACLPSANSSTYSSLYSRTAKQRNPPPPRPPPTRYYFRHMRKAGGTYLVKRLRALIASNQTSYTDLTVCEGEKGCLELNPIEDGYHKYYPEERTSTLYEEMRNEMLQILQEQQQHLDDCRSNTTSTTTTTTTNTTNTTNNTKTKMKPRRNTLYKHHPPS